MNQSLQYINVFTYLSLLFLILFSTIKVKDNIITRIISIAILVMVLGILPSFRTIYYGDTANYYDYYVNYFEIARFEYLFSQVSLFSHYIGFDFLSYITSISILTSFLYVYSLHKVSRVCDIKVKCFIYATLSSLVFFSYFYMTFEAIRDGISTSVIILSLYYLSFNKKKTFILLVFVSSLFHKASLLFFPLIFIGVFKKLKPNNYLILFILAICFSFVLKGFILNLSFLGDKIIYLLDFYSQDRVLSKTVLIRYILIFIISLIFLKSHKSSNEVDYKIVESILFITIIFTFFYSFPDMYRRLLLKLEFISYPILIMVYLNRLSGRIKYFYFSIFISIYYILFMSNYYSYYMLLNIKPVSSL
ncbi:EpsG family protein [Vibrio alginolyticus]|uniref:EpsG family protein n=1 Tax=Vibrio alginolyticus TaxID=663 RepID=UPI003D7D97C4